MTVALPDARYDSEDKVNAFFDRLLEDCVRCRESQASPSAQTFPSTKTSGIAAFT